MTTITQTRSRPILRNLALAIVLSAGIAVSGCATPSREPSLTIAESDSAEMLGLHNARFRIVDTTAITREFIAAGRKEIEARQRDGQQGPLPPATFLAISGGGDEGAYGAGLLVGWTARGDRPTFRAVTGVSTGALSAPFAFLGPEYDEQLKAVYTTTSAKSVFKRRGLIAALTSDALGDTAPLHELLRRYLDDHMVQRIAEEYAKGRLLLIMTTNLDAGEPCIWNIGAIAASGQPGARELIVKILMASSAIPAAFPPVLFDVQVNGEHRQEMHVDGGVFAQAFLYPPTIDVKETTKLIGDRQREAYIIRNGRLLSSSVLVKRSTLTIAGRAVALMIGNSGMNDMFRIYAITSRDHVGFHLTYIPSGFTEPYKGPFDEAYMNKLYAYGYERGRSGDAWQSAPPGWGGQPLEGR